MKIKKEKMNIETLKEFGFEILNEQCFSKTLVDESNGTIRILIYRQDFAGFKEREVYIYTSNDCSYEGHVESCPCCDCNVDVDTYDCFDEVAPIDAVIELYTGGLLETL